MLLTASSGTTQVPITLAESDGAWQSMSAGFVLHEIAILWARSAAPKLAIVPTSVFGDTLAKTFSRTYCAVGFGFRTNSKSLSWLAARNRLGKLWSSNVQQVLLQCLSL